MQNSDGIINPHFQLNKSLLLNRGSQLALDAAVLSAVFVLSYLLRFEFNLDEGERQLCLTQLAIAVPLQAAVFRFFGVYRQIWRYVSIPEANRIWIALLASAATLLFIRVFFYQTAEWAAIPVSIIIFDFFTASIGVIGLRVARRVVYEHFHKKQTSAAASAASANGAGKKTVFLIGAGKAGVKTLAEIKERGDSGLDVRGFIDDDPLKKRAVINGVEVLGTIDDLPRLVKQKGIDHVIISIAQTTGKNIRRIVDVCEKIPIRVRTIPGLYELLQEKVTISRIRDVQIDDLLARPAIELDRENIENFLKNKTVMVTGAGGSIGSELVRQIISCRPQKILLIERSELALFNIEREIRNLSKSADCCPILADICSRLQMSKIFERYSPEVVFHAAAHKHVPLMESNTAEAVKNNVMGTLCVAELAGRFGCEAFVLISTDKAVNPTSVMGATKRVAELVIQNLNQTYETRYSAVRFGNVIGSAGSVIPIFQEQIKKGGPVTVTHPEMRRYFMTIPEASQLVLQAGAIGRGGEIFILDMGEQVKIIDLARETIRLSGLRAGEDIEIVYKGIRPGEKLYEELEMISEELVKTLHPKIFIGKIFPYPPETIREAIEKLSGYALAENENEIRCYLCELLPEARLSREANSKATNVTAASADLRSGAFKSGAQKTNDVNGLPYSFTKPAESVV